MKLPFFIARRYFFSKNNLSAINIITGISVAAYAVGAFALIGLLSALNGFETTIFKVYETYYPDLKITPIKGKVFEPDSVVILKIKNLPNTAHLALTLEENAIISNGDNQVVGIIKGVDSQFVKVVKVDSLIVAGNSDLTRNGASYAWLAEGLYYKLNLGSESKIVNVMAPARESAGVSQMDMMEDVLNVASVIRPGDELDQKLLVTNLDFARSLFDRESKISAIEVKTKPGSNNELVKKAIAKITGNHFHVRTRQEQNQAVYKMFNTEKWVAFAIMSFVLLIISFNLIGALSMLILEKKPDRGILRAMGLKPIHIRKIFFNEGVLVALTGSLLGVLTGIVVVLLQQKFGFIQTNATFVSAYPVELRLQDIILVLCLCCAMGVSVSIYPAWKSSSKQ